jgi:hypothetical protein
MGAPMSTNTKNAAIRTKASMGVPFFGGIWECIWAKHRTLGARDSVTLR